MHHKGTEAIYLPRAIFISLTDIVLPPVAGIVIGARAANVGEILLIAGIFCF
ncbi:MAG: hypothetical protein AAF665_16900 [Pseudomonadota bacterium]